MDRYSPRSSCFAFAAEEMHDFWHGSKWRQFQDFFRPDKHWIQPAICEHCSHAHFAWPEESATIKEKKLIQEGLFEVICQHCERSFVWKPVYMQGDMRNLAFLLHMDGFQATTTRQRSIIAWNLVICNGGKKSILEKPEFILPLMSESVDAETDMHDVFMQIIVKELNLLFYHGVEVEYALDVEDLPKQTTQHGILLAISGDHVAQCEITKTSRGGHFPCRRCSVNNSLSRSKFADIHFKTRFPDPERLDERKRRKDFILERGLLNVKRQQALDRKRSKEERELFQRSRVFLRYHPTEENDALLAGLTAEIKLRQRIEELQEYRSAGCHTLAEGELYMMEKRKRSMEASMRKGRESAVLNNKVSNRSNRSTNRDGWFFNRITSTSSE